MTGARELLDAARRRARLVAEIRVPVDESVSYGVVALDQLGRGGPHQQFFLVQKEPGVLMIEGQFRPDRELANEELALICDYLEHLDLELGIEK